MQYVAESMLVFYMDQTYKHEHWLDAFEEQLSTYIIHNRSTPATSLQTPRGSRTLVCLELGFQGSVYVFD